MKLTSRGLVAALIMLISVPSAFAEQLTLPETLTLQECIERGLKYNPDILKSKQEIRRTYGLVVETRAPVIPQVNISGQYSRLDENLIDSFPGSGGSIFQNQRQPWAAEIEVSQLVYAGGRVMAAIRAAKLVDQIAVLGFRRTVADTILEIRRSFYQILLNQALVNVREQSTKLLEQQLVDTQHRYDVGAVPRFNVLRAEVELANAKPPLIRAQNDLRLSKESLIKLLALDSPTDTKNFTTVDFVGQLTYDHFEWDLPTALNWALQNRPELKQAGKEVRVAKENIKVARAGYQPELRVFGNYGWRNTIFSDQIDDRLDGWTIGARLSWPLFDGLLTRGKVIQARAQLQSSELNLADTRRGIELEVRQAYSDYLQALELIEAQKKTVEQGDESLRLAEARFRAGTGTQLDVLSAQTALTEARSNEIQALFDYNVAIASLERVTGTTVQAAE